MEHWLTALVIVLIIIVILFIAVMTRKLSIWGPKNLTYYQKNARESFGDVTGESWNRSNQDTIDYSASVPASVRTAYDHFIVGATYMYGRQYPTRIAENYGAALAEVKAGNVYADERDVVLDRIRDHVMFHPEPFGDLDDLQGPLLEIYHDLRTLPTKPIKPRPIPTTVAGRVENLKPIIRNDKENVHSSAVTAEFAKQFKKIRIYNDRDARGLDPIVIDDEKSADLTAIRDGLASLDKPLEIEQNARAHAEALAWIRENTDDPGRELERRLVNDFSVYDITEPKHTPITERDVLAATWRRINSPANVNNRDNLLDAFRVQLGECSQGGKIVCTTGRVENIHATFAMNDVDKKLGILKTDDMLRDEIYTAGAKIIAEEVAKLSTNDQKTYNSGGEHTEPIKAMIAKCYGRIDTELAKYRPKLPLAAFDTIITNIKNECT